MSKFQYQQEARAFGITSETPIPLQEQKFIFESVVASVISSLVQTAAKVKGKDNRTHNRILNKLDLDESGAITLEQAEVDFLNTILFHDEVCVPPQQIRALGLFQDLVEEILSEQKK